MNNVERLSLAYLTELPYSLAVKSYMREIGGLIHYNQLALEANLYSGFAYFCNGF
jgi:hypothetical protein